TEIALQMGGDNIMVTGAEGPYDVYFDKANLKVWVMTPGTTPGAAPETPVTPVTEGVIWENDGTVGAATWSGSPYRFSIEGGDSLNECVAEIPAAVWAGMKIAPFSVNITPDPAATWWQIRVLDGWWTNNDESGASDININTPGLVDNGNGTYTFVVDLTTNPELSTLIDTQHLLFAGDGFIINKIYFGEPETPEQPEPAKSDWHIVGSFTGSGWGWDAAAGIALDIIDANYFGLLGFELPEGAQFKFLQGTAWGGAEVGAVASVVEPNTIQAKGTNNIMGIPAGKYDIYLAADASAFYIMSEGKTPAEATEPAPVQVTYTVTGTLNGINWNNAAPEGLMTEEGGVYVAKNVPLVWEATLYGGAEQIAIKIFETGTWNGYGVNDTAVHEANTEIPVVYGGANNVNIAAPEGTYDVYFDKTNEKVWIVPVGQSEQPETPSQVVYADDFEWLAEIAAAAGAGDSVGEDNASAKAPNVWKMDNSADFFAAFNERGYQYLYSTVGMTEYAAGPAQEPNPEVGKEGSLYVQTNYLKFGQSSYNGAIVLPALAAIEGTADVVIEFDWCWQVTGKNKADIMTMSVDATAGTFEATAAATSANIESAQSLVDGESHLAWQHATVVLNGATAETILTIRPTYADPSVQNPERSQNRWFLDNIKVSTK
ncbi:MAG: hypothetical protein IIX08_10680, partial [Bacteroidales bacterium]|nr:hypothetical protein [Bacteroidales bacterium]